MIEPSSIRHPQGYKPITKEVKPGLYVVENAYEGEYVYFENDPFPSNELSAGSLDEDETVEQTSQPELVGLGEKMHQRIGTDTPAPTNNPQIVEEVSSEQSVNIRFNTNR